LIFSLPRSGEYAFRCQIRFSFRVTVANRLLSLCEREFGWPVALEVAKVLRKAAENGMMKQIALNNIWQLAVREEESECHARSGSGCRCISRFSRRV